MVLAFGLKDLGYRGNPFTWANNRFGQAYVATRLDKAFSNSHWLASFEDPLITHLPRLCSDHSSLLLSHRPRFSSSKIPFKFEAMWLSHESFLHVVESNWSISYNGTPQFVLATKLKILKQNLKIWNRETFGQLSARISEAGQVILDGQKNLDANPSEALLLELNTTKSSLHN